MALRALPAAALAGLAALALLPAAAGSTAQVSFSDTFGTAPLRVEGELVGGEASSVRRLMDSDRDGTVTQREVDQVVTGFKSYIGSMVAKMGNFTLDGRAPVDAPINDLVIDGAAGPVSGGGAIAFEVGLTFLFDPDDGATHVLRIVSRPTLGGIMHVNLTLPSGWHVANVTGLPGVQGGSEVRAVEFDMPTRNEELTFTFAADPKGSPAALGAAACAVLVLLAALGRRGDPA